MRDTFCMMVHQESHSCWEYDKRCAAADAAPAHRKHAA